MVSITFVILDIDNIEIMSDDEVEGSSISSRRVYHYRVKLNVTYHFVFSQRLSANNLKNIFIYLIILASL